MNAFQIGLATFKFDATEKKIISRPFNIYLFPYSDNHINYYRNGILDQPQVLEFTPGCLRFNTRNNFNFNKLFRMGLNYRRISTKGVIRKLVEERAQIFHCNDVKGERRSAMPKDIQRSKWCLSKEEKVHL